MPREACLRAALHAYPAVDRREYGADLLDAATDLAELGSTSKEFAGLLRGGLEARVRRGRAGLLAVDRRAAGDVLAAPLASAVVAIWGAAAIARISGGVGTGAAPGFTLGSVLLLVTLALLVIAVARRQRVLATSASLVLLAQVTISVGWVQWRGGIVTAAPHMHLHVGPWWFGPSLVWALVPFLVLLVGCCWVIAPASPRLPGLPRALRESSLARLLVLLAPSVGLGAVLVLQPALISGNGGTTELPGLLFLMVIVAAFWLATSRPAGRNHWSAAAGLLGIAAVPSVAYGLAGLLTPLLSGVGAPTTRIGLALALSTLVVLSSMAVFVAALASVGLRTGVGRPAHGVSTAPRRALE
ncbi:MAG: hypothetical protein JHD16_17250 [Solirubrobacteraceae bacterium]|nr:hypothetical protein [Solirubrobacteraceae bacterium]